MTEPKTALDTTTCHGEHDIVRFIPTNNNNNKENTMTTTKPTTDTLEHPSVCARDRIEVIDYPTRGITTRHCLDCGAHEARKTGGDLLPIPEIVGGMAESMLQPTEHGSTAPKGNI